MNAGRPAGRHVAVIIISYNTKALLDKCLTTLKPELCDGDEVVVLDNASSDGSADLVAAAHPWVALIRSPTNLGWGAGCNEAVRRTTAAWILLLNPDTVVFPGTIVGLLDFAERRPDGGLYGGRTVGSDDQLDPRSCWAAPSVWSIFCSAVGLTTAFRRSRLFDPESMGSWQRDDERHVDIVTGCLLLVSRQWWDRLGGFAEKYFMYGEDADFNMRARKLGARPTITPAATIQHVVGASSTRPDKLVYVLRGKLTYAYDHFDFFRARLAMVLMLLGVFLRGLVWPALFRRTNAWTAVWNRRREWLNRYR